MAIYVPLSNLVVVMGLFPWQPTFSGYQSRIAHPVRNVASQTGCSNSNLPGNEVAVMGHRRYHRDIVFTPGVPFITVHLSLYHFPLALRHAFDPILSLLASLLL